MSTSVSYPGFPGACLPQLALWEGCSDDFAPGARIHLAVALVLSLVAALLCLFALIPRMVKLREGANSFFVFVMYECVGFIFIGLVNALRISGLSVPPFVIAIFWTLGLDCLGFGVGYLGMCWSEAQRKDSFMVYQGLRKYKWNFRASVFVTISVTTIPAVIGATSMERYMVAWRIWLIAFPTACIWPVGTFMYAGIKAYKKLAAAGSPAAVQMKRNVVGLGVLLPLLALYTFYGAALQLVDTTPWLWHLCHSASNHAGFLLAVPLPFWSWRHMKVISQGHVHTTPTNKASTTSHSKTNSAPTTKDEELASTSSSCSSSESSSE